MTPSDAVFSNDFLLDKILEYVVRIDYRSWSNALHVLPGCILDHLELRTVSRSFDNVVVRMVQREFRDFTVGYRREEIKEEEEEEEKKKKKKEEEEEDIMEVCDYEIPSAKSRQFFEFLRKVMRVKVRSIEVKDVYRWRGPRTQLHAQIWESLIGDNYKSLNSVTGMEDICPRNCVHCPRVATQCHKYGPLQEDVLREAFLHAHHFHTLIVSDRLLNRIASRCTLGSETKEECLAALEEMVHSRLSCSHLILIVEENPYNPVHRREEKFADTQALPREVIDRMLIAWKVRSVEIRLHSTIRFWIGLTTDSYDFRIPFFSIYWSHKGFLTPVRIDDDFHDYEPSHLRLDSVILNLEHSFYSRHPFFGPANGNLSFPHVLPIVHRLFSTSKMRVVLPRRVTRHDDFDDFKDLSKILEKFEEYVWQHDPTDFHLEILYYPRSCEVHHQTGLKFADFNVEWEKVNLHPSETLTPYFGKTFRVVDAHKDWSISVEVLFDGAAIASEYDDAYFQFKDIDEVSEITWDYVFAYRRWVRCVL